MTLAVEVKQTYESYKDSGIDWIGDIPEDWKLKPFRALFHFRNEKNDPVKTDNVLSLSIANGVTEYTEAGRGGNKRKDDLTAYKLAYPGDIVLNSMNVIVGAVGLSKYFGAISPVYYALHRKHDHSNINYFENLFLDKSFQKGLLRHGKGIMMKQSDSGKLNTIRMKISTDDLKKIYFPFPPKKEQDKIVTFIDKKTTQIDQAINIKEQQIALLKERKQIIIQNAVTKGLDPNVPMKDSGVNWIGDIPEHWDGQRLKNTVNSCENGFWGQDPKGVNDTIVLRVSDFNRDKLSINSNNLTTRFILPKDFLSRSLKFGDLLIEKSGGGDKTLVGCVVLFDKSFHAITSNFVSKMTPNKIFDNSFLKYVFCSLYSNKINYRSIKQTTGIQNLDFQSYLNERFYFPKKKEQQAIANFLDKKTTQIDQAINIKEQQIALLKEYKASLINSAVTGKIKVI